MRKVLAHRQRDPVATVDVRPGDAISRTAVERESIDGRVITVRYLDLGAHEIPGLVDQLSAALFLGVNEDTLGREFRAGRIARVTIRGRVLFTLDDLLKYIAANRRYAGEESRLD